MKLLIVNQDRVAFELEGTLTTKEFEAVRFPRSWHQAKLFMKHNGTTSFVDILTTVYHRDYVTFLWPDTSDNDSEFDVL